MSDFTDYGENKICRLLTGGTFSLPANFDVGLLSDVSDTAYTEISFTGYSRVSAPRNLNTWSGTQGAGTITASNGTSRQISNNVAFDFGDTDADITVNAVGLFDDGELFCYALFNSPIVANAGSQVIVDVGYVVFSLAPTGGLTNSAANILLDCVFRGQVYSPSSQWRVALYTQTPSLAGTGGVEVSGGGYSRVAFDSWQIVNDIASNASAVSFPAPTGNWGTITGCALFDSIGNMMFADSFTQPVSIVSGAGAPRFSAGSIGIMVA